MVEGAGGREAMPMACFSEQAQTLFKDWKQDQLLANLERDHAELVERRVASIHYGDPNALTPKKRTMLMFLKDTVSSIAQQMTEPRINILEAATRQSLARVWPRRERRKSLRE